MKYLLLFLKISLLVSVFISSSKAQNWNQILKVAAADRENITSSGRSSNDYFGYSVAIYGNYAIAGSLCEREDSEGKNEKNCSGAAYLFKLINGSWVKIKKITAEDRSAQANFGHSVALNDDYAVISASESGVRAVYVFKKDEGGVENWGQVKKIEAPTSDAYSEVGTSVAIDGDYIVVGTPFEGRDASGGNYLALAGAVYLFKKDQGGTDNWGQIKKIVPPTRNEGGYFGFSVSISSDCILIGSPWDDYDDTQSYYLRDAGSAYLFRKDQDGADQWGFQKKIVSSRRSYSGRFGYSVAIAGYRAVVGAVGEDFNYSDERSEEIGAAYFFKRDDGGANNWGRVKLITPPFGVSNDRFGYSVAISGDQVVVGADLESEDQNESNTVYNSGSAYIFREDKDGSANWGLVRKITAPVRATRDLFGCAVSINGENVIVGAWAESDDAREENRLDFSGSAYIFNKNIGGTENWGFNNKITASTGALESAYFGSAVAISGNYAVVGAKFDQKDVDGMNPISSAGAAYILFNDAGTWKQIKKICAPYRYAGDGFGKSVSIQGENIVVGAPYHQYDGVEGSPIEGAGAAYIFNKNQGGSNNWGLIEKVVPNNRDRNTNFGAAVSVFSEYVAVGAWTETPDPDLSSAGSVYIFKRDQGGANAWGQLKKITPQVRLRYMNFGFSLSLTNNLLLVGAPSETINPQTTGSPVYIGAGYFFEKDFGGEDNWGQSQRIVADPLTVSGFSNFGQAVATDGTYAVIGASYDNLDLNESNFLTNAGSAYIFKRENAGSGNWVRLKKMVSLIRKVSDRFGESVALSGNYVIVGSQWTDQATAGDDRGAAFIFKKDQGGADQWGYAQQLFRTSNPVNFDYFGSQVAISGRYAIVGASAEDEDGREANTIKDTGAAYFFQNFDAALPVTLISFEARKVEKQSVLTWKTTEETNSAYFEIQKSRDGRNWLGLDEHVKANGAAHAYTFTDFAPFQGENLYRLKMVDLDGSFAFSQIRSVTFDHDSELLIFPNPVSDRLYLAPSVKVSEIESIQIFNNLGQKVLHTHENIKDGLSVNTLGSGTFTVQIRHANGDIKTQQILIAR